MFVEFAENAQLEAEVAALKKLVSADASSEQDRAPPAPSAGELDELRRQHAWVFLMKHVCVCVCVFLLVLAFLQCAN